MRLHLVGSDDCGRIFKERLMAGISVVRTETASTGHLSEIQFDQFTNLAEPNGLIDRVGAESYHDTKFKLSTIATEKQALHAGSHLRQC